MYILLVAATTFEIQPTIDSLGLKPATAATGPPGPGQQPGIEYLITGIGSMAATYTLTRQIGSKRPDIIIQAGIAGCFRQCPPGTSLVVKEEMTGDLGVWEQENFRTVFDLKLQDKDAAPYSNGLLINPYRQLLDLTGLEQVRAITVNEISTDSRRIEWHRQHTRPVVESMEGAALHLVCLYEQIPFLQLRSVSNEIGIRDKSKWNIPSAIAGLNKELAALLNKLDRQARGFIHL